MFGTSGGVAPGRTATAMLSTPFSALLARHRDLPSDERKMQQASSVRRENRAKRSGYEGNDELILRNLQALRFLRKFTQRH